MATITKTPSILYRGWAVLCGAFATNALAVGTTQFAFGVFVIPASQELHLSRADANTVLIAMGLGSALCAPFAGRLLDRFSIRAIMAIGGLLLATGLVAISLMSSPLAIMAVAFAPIAFGALCAGALAGNTATARWFRMHRGRALGILATGSSAGGFVISPLAGYLNDQLGWRMALASLGLTAGLIIVLVAIFLIRTRPHETEMRDAGELLDTSETEQKVEQRVWRIPELLTNRNFLLLVFGAGLLLASDRAILVSVVPYLHDSGISLQMAAFMLSVLSGSAIAGKLLVGYTSDYVNPRSLYLVVAFLHIVLLTMLIVQPGYWVMMTGSVIVGMGMGGVLPVKQILNVSVFGSASFGAVLGLAALILEVLMMIALRFVGEVHDRTGSYDLAFQVFIGLVLLSALMVWQVKIPKKSPGATQPVAAEVTV